MYDITINFVKIVKILSNSMESSLYYILHTFAVTKGKLILSFAYTIFAYLIGGFDIMVQALYILLILDFILWFLDAWQKHILSKKKMQLWIIKIITYSITLIVVHYADVSSMSIDIGWVWIREIGVSYLSINEALSCLRHLSVFWVPLPIWLIKKLEWYKDNLETK